MENNLTIDVLQPGEIIRPMIGQESVPTLLKKYYGLEIKSVKQLNGYDDKNFFVQVSKSENPFLQNVSKNGYIFKILNSKDSESSDFIKIQNNMMQHLNQSQIGVCVSTPLSNLDGSYFSYEIIQETQDRTVTTNNQDSSKAVCKKHILRLLNYIPGKMMKDVNYSKEIIYEVGKLSGRLYNQLKNFQKEQLINRKTVWQLESVPLLHKFLFAITDEEKSSLVKEVLASWETLVVPLIPSLERSVVHGDINEQNIIMVNSNEEAQPGNSHLFRNIFGLLDFGDISVSPSIFELAISIAYVIFEVNTMDPNEAGGYVVAGYSTEREITPNEWNILRECVAARFAQSLILGAYSYLNDPGNEYLLGTAKKGWERLRQFWSTPKDDLITKWKSMMSFRLNYVK